MNYGELKTRLVTLARRDNDPKTVAEVPGFIRDAEGMIRRKLSAYALTGTITEAERLGPSEPVYRMPAWARVIRRVEFEGRPLSQLTINELPRYQLEGEPVFYARLSSGLIEFRGNPPTDATFDLVYFGQPVPLANDADTNELLTDHETLYLAAAKFHLYQFTNSDQQAQNELSVFTDAVESLNELMAREIGGATAEAVYDEFTTIESSY